MRTITLKDMIEKYGIDIFDFDYSFNKKKDFEERFKDWYWFRNIGFETTDMFLHWLRVEVQRKSEYYNRLLKEYEGLEVKLFRGHEQIIDHKRKIDGLRKLDGVDKVLNEHTDLLLSEMERNIEDTVKQLREITGDSETSNTTKSKANSISESLDKLEELGSALDTILKSTIPYESEEEIDVLRGIDEVNKTKSETSGERTNTGKTDNETITETTDTGTVSSTDKEDASTTTTGLTKDTGKNDRKVSGQTDSTRKETVNDETVDEYITKISVIEKPLFEAMNELEMVSLDVVQKFVLSLNDLFALVY